MEGSAGEVQGAPADPAQGAADARRVERARMLHYRLVPLWFFAGTMGVLLVWEAGVRGSALTAERLQGIALISLLVAVVLGATVGIRYSDPLPPKK